jgi:hemin uptake protein HemP
MTAGEKEKKVEAEAGADSKRSARTERVIPARDLFGAERIVRIEHNGEIYTLRMTRNDRLILTK